QGPHGTQSADRRTDSDQGQDRSEVPRSEIREGRDRPEEGVVQAWRGHFCPHKRPARAGLCYCSGTARPRPASFFSKLKELDWGAVFDDKSYCHPIGWRVRRDDDLLPFQFCCQVIYLEGDVRHSPDKVGNARLGLEAHPFDSVCAGFISRYIRRVAYDKFLSFATLAGRNSEVVIPAHRLAFYRNQAGGPNPPCSTASY